MRSFHLFLAGFSTAVAAVCFVEGQAMMGAFNASVVILNMWRAQVLARKEQ